MAIFMQPCHKYSLDSNNGYNNTPYTPQQIKAAYRFDPMYQGDGITIAIVDAYGNPNMQGDLQVFNQRFNLPPANLQIVYPQGVPSTVDPGWALETSLDVE